MTEIKESGLKFLRRKEGRDIYYMELDQLDLHKSKDGYLAVCPICKAKHRDGIDGFYEDPNYNKRKLSINHSLSLAHCFRCDSVILGYKDSTIAHVPNLDFHVAIESDDISITTLIDVNEKYEKSKILDEPKIKLIKSRNSYLDPNELGMRSGIWNRPNILTPFYLKGQLIYFQLRFLDKLTPKYFSPSIKNKPIYIPPIHNESKDLIICEGVYDALALMILYPDKTPVAILGSAITDYQCNLIRKYLTPNSISIFMDKTEISESIREDIESTPLGYYIDDIEIIESDGVDPEEKLRGYNIDIADTYENIIKG